MTERLADGQVLFESRGHVAIVTLNRPETLNALTREMIVGLAQAFDRVQKDREIRAAVLTGAGGRAFCSGADLGQFIPQVAAEGLDVLIDDPTKRFMSDIFKPIVAAIHGPCIAGGLEILLGTDIRIAAEGAVFGLGEVRWGLVPAAGSHIRLPRQIPWAVAMEMLLGGRTISAERAREVGLVNEVVPVDAVLGRAMAWAELIAGNSPLAVRTAKEIAVRGMALEAGFVLEAAAAAPVFRSDDAIEGPRAFIEKRRPKFRD
jgi:enoyl-CoA hydratase